MHGETSHLNWFNDVKGAKGSCVGVHGAGILLERDLLSASPGLIPCPHKRERERGVPPRKELPGGTAFLRLRHRARHQQAEGRRGCTFGTGASHRDAPGPNHQKGPLGRVEGVESVACVNL